MVAGPPGTPASSDRRAGATGRGRPWPSDSRTGYNRCARLAHCAGRIGWKRPMIEREGRQDPAGKAHPRPSEASRPARFVLLAGLSIAWASGAPAADIEDAERLYRTGQYAECARLAERETRGVRGEPWHLLKIRAEL